MCQLSSLLHMQYADTKNLFKKISIYATDHTKFEIDWKKYLLKKQL